MAKSHFKKIVFILFLIAGIVLGVLYINMFTNKVIIKECSDKELIKKVVENLHEQQNDSKVNIDKVFYYNLPDSNYFLCGYVIEKIYNNDIRNKFVVFSDKTVSFIFIGDIIDIKNKKIVGYEELIQGFNNTASQGEQCGSSSNK